MPGSTFLMSCLFSWDIVSFSTDVLGVTLACPVISTHPLQQWCYYNWGSMVYLQQYCEMSLNMRLTEELIFIRLKRSELLHLGIWFKAVGCYCELTIYSFFPTWIDNHSIFLYCEYHHLMIYGNFWIFIAKHQSHFESELCAGDDSGCWAELEIENNTGRKV